MHLVQRLLSLRETRVPGRRKHRVEDFRRRVSVVRRSAASDLVQGLPQKLVPPFPLHQVFSPFLSSNPSVLVHKSPQILVLSFPLHQVFGPFRSFNPLGLVQRLPQNLIPSSRGTTPSPPDGIGKGSADEFAIRLHFLPLLFCIDRKSSGAIAPLLFLHNSIKFYYFTFPLLFGAV